MINDSMSTTEDDASTKRAFLCLYRDVCLPFLFYNFKNEIVILVFMLYTLRIYFWCFWNQFVAPVSYNN